MVSRASAFRMPVSTLSSSREWARRCVTVFKAYAGVCLRWLPPKGGFDTEEETSEIVKRASYAMLALALFEYIAGLFTTTELMWGAVWLAFLADWIRAQGNRLAACLLLASATLFLCVVPVEGIHGIHWITFLLGLCLFPLSVKAVVATFKLQRLRRRQRKLQSPIQ
jgi:hypothetical protein